MNEYLKRYWKHFIGTFIGMEILFYGSLYCFFAIKQDWGMLLGSIAFISGFIICVLSIPAEIGTPRERIRLFLFETKFFSFFILVVTALSFFSFGYSRLHNFGQAFAGTLACISAMSVGWMFLRVKYFRKEEVNHE